MEEKKKPHVVCIPAPAQGHINPMMQVAKLLHSRGFFITFVHTDFSHKRLLGSKGKESLDGLEDFRFEVISDGLPTAAEMMEDFEAFCRSLTKNCTAPFRDLITKLHQPSDGRAVTCIVSDAFMPFTLKVAEEVGIPEVLFYPAAACSLMAFANYHEVIRRGLESLGGESYNNYDQETIIDWIPGMKEMRIRDLGSFLQTTDPDDFMLNYMTDAAETALKASMIIFNSFEDLEHEILHAFRTMFPPRIYSIGPLSLQCRLLPDNGLKSVKLSMLKEETRCLKWLDSYEAASVIYVNFGSTTVTTPQQLIEFAWGLADSNHPFLWVIRPDLVTGGNANLPQEFIDEIKGRGMLVSWCPQEEVLAHPSIAVFLTHCGWNSTLESISFAVPMLCWPFCGDQQTNCRYACKEWGVGIEIDNNAKREEICFLFREVMEGEKGKEMRKKAMMWKWRCEIAVKEGGSSHTDLALLIDELLQQKDDAGKETRSTSRLIDLLLE